VNRTLRRQVRMNHEAGSHKSLDSHIPNLSGSRKSGSVITQTSKQRSMHKLEYCLVTYCHPGILGEAAGG
jgi:hypothetical protein